MSKEMMEGWIVWMVGRMGVASPRPSALDPTWNGEAYQEEPAKETQQEQQQAAQAAQGSIAQKGYCIIIARIE